MRRKRSAIEDLRTAIDCLPVETRVAMLVGVRSNDIIVGAYTDRSGGVCPMLAAHRCGGRTSLISFAHAWDRFTGARGRARRASERELRILTTHIETSLLAEQAPDLEKVVAEHRASGERTRAPRRMRPGDPDRSRELAQRDGSAWLRPFRRYDDYKRALERVEAGAGEPAPAPAEHERELV
jgi:hypothetical protein